MQRSATMHLNVETAAQDNESTGVDAQVEAAEATGEMGVAAPMPWSKRLARLSYRVGRYAPLLLFFLIWEFVSRSDPALMHLLPPPTKVFKAALELTARGELQEHILASLKRVAVALILACGVGFPLGAALGASRTFQWFFEPIVSFFRPIPPLAWIPMSIVWLGIGDAQNEFIIFLGAFFPIVLNTMQGVRDVEKQFIRAAQTLGASRLSIAWTVILPSALSAMFIGLRVGLGIAWMALVAGELVAATSGLGFLISQGRLLFRTDYIVVGMVMIGVIGLLLDVGIVGIQRLVMPWQQK